MGVTNWLSIIPLRADSELNLLWKNKNIKRHSDCEIEICDT